MSRDRLRRCGIDLPLLPTSAVGSLPKPPELRAARADYAHGRLSQRELDELAAEVTIFWLRQQEEIGLDVLVDGELYRGDMVAYFAEQLAGMELGGLVRSYGNRYYHKPIITGPVRWEQPITLGWFQFAQHHTRRPVKAILTGPYTMMDWSFDEHYGERRAACLAFASELRKEVDALVAAGARIIQIDEPALSARPAELPLVCEATQLMTAGVDAYFVTHACYGAFDAVYPGINELATDNLDLAISHSSRDLLALLDRSPLRHDLSAGVIDVHTHEVESTAIVAQRIRRALAATSTEALWITPDCGLKTRTPDEATAKLRVMVAAAAGVRTSLSA